MKRYSIKDIIAMPHSLPPANYNNQVAVICTTLSDCRNKKELLYLESFVIGYVAHGSSTSEFNNNVYHLEENDTFLLAPTHSCRLVDCSPDYTVRLLLMDPNQSNLTIHLDQLIKRERWTHSYFHPVLRTNSYEAGLMKTCTDRIANQIARTQNPNQSELIKLAIEWHHLELDSIMQKHMNVWTDSGQPPSRHHTIARTLYILVINNYRKEHRTDFYANKMFLSIQYLNRVTGEILGQSLGTIINNLLFSTARSMLLSSDLTLQEIADELNFEDLTAFSKFFKKTAGVSPRKFIKENKHQNTIEIRQTCSLV